MESSIEIYKIMRSQNQELKAEVKELKEKIQVLESLKVSIVRFQDLIHEDDLPEMTDQEYKEWFKTSVVVDGVRMGNDPAKKTGVSDGIEGALRDLLDKTRKYLLWSFEEEKAALQESVTNGYNVLSNKENLL
jgi:hypothetical protein